jgi:hypothetical protein
MSSFNKSFNMSQINEALIGVDYHQTVNAYLVRDKLMNIDPNEHVVHCLQKLGYFNLNMPVEIQKFLASETSKKIQLSLTDDMDSTYRYKTVDQIMEEVKNSKEFNNFMYKLNHRFSRAITLSTFLKNPDMEKFYMSLSFEELNYLGY